MFRGLHISTEGRGWYDRIEPPGIVLPVPDGTSGLGQGREGAIEQTFRQIIPPIRRSYISHSNDQAAQQDYKAVPEMGLPAVMPDFRLNRPPIQARLDKLDSALDLAVVQFLGGVREYGMGHK